MVVDNGGLLCHAAMIAGEDGISAVVGTGNGARRSRTGRSSGVIPPPEPSPVRTDFQLSSGAK